MPELHPYQQIGAAWLSGRRTALLADEMGLGKSAQAIAACDALCAQRVLVICPASVVENWRREFEKFSAFGITPVVVSYNGAVPYRTAPPDGAGGRWDALIIDEAHYAKSRDAKRTQVLYGPKCDGVGGLVEKAGHVFLLTGTPMPNNPSELWTHLRALAPETILGKSAGKPMAFWQFVSAYCTTRDNGFGTVITGGKRHDVLREKLEGFMLRRLKSEVLKDLPPITWGEVYVEGSLDASVSTEAARVAAVLDAKGVDGLREIALHVATLRRLTGLAKVAPVVEWVKEWLESTDRKIVIFAHHTEVVDTLAWHLSQVCGLVTLSGSTTSKARQYYVDLFQTDPTVRVFVGQITAAGVGITLTASSDVLFVELSWVPAENSQAAQRCHRIGTVNPVLVRFAVLSGSIDEQIQKAVARKTADITKILD